MLFKKVSVIAIFFMITEIFCKNKPCSSINTNNFKKLRVHEFPFNKVFYMKYGTAIENIRTDHPFYFDLGYMYVKAMITQCFPQKMSCYQMQFACYIQNFTETMDFSARILLLKVDNEIITKFERTKNMIPHDLHSVSSSMSFHIVDYDHENYVAVYSCIDTHYEYAIFTNIEINQYFDESMLNVTEHIFQMKSHKFRERKKVLYDPKICAEYKIPQSAHRSWILEILVVLILGIMIFSFAFMKYVEMRDKYRVSPYLN